MLGHFSHKNRPIGSRGFCTDECTRTSNNSVVWSDQSRYKSSFSIIFVGILVTGPLVGNSPFRNDQCIPVSCVSFDTTTFHFNFAVRINEPWVDRTAFDVPYLRVSWDFDVGTYIGDDSMLYDQSPVCDFFSRLGDNLRTDKCVVVGSIFSQTFDGTRRFLAPSHRRCDDKNSEKESNRSF